MPSASMVSSRMERISRRRKSNISSRSSSLSHHLTLNQWTRYLSTLTQEESQLQITLHFMPKVATSRLEKATQTAQMMMILAVIQSREPKGRRRCKVIPKSLVQQLGSSQYHLPNRIPKMMSLAQHSDSTTLLCIQWPSNFCKQCRWKTSRTICWQKMNSFYSNSKQSKRKQWKLRYHYPNHWKRLKTAK